LPATATRSSKRPLTGAQVEQIRAVEARVAKAKRQLEVATEERAAVRDRYRDRLPENTPVEAGGCLIKRIVKSTGRRFRLTEYLREHRLSDEMRPYVTKAGKSERWDVKPLS
jgi:hypothetical protein